MNNRRIRKSVAICAFGLLLVFTAAFGTCYAISFPESYAKWPSGFLNLHTHVSKKYAFTKWKGIHWDTLAKRSFGDVIRASFNNDVGAYYTALREYLFSIPDGHVFLIPNPFADDDAYQCARELQNTLLEEHIGAGYGLGVTHLGDRRIIVYYLRPGSSADQAGIQIGTEVVQWNGEPVQAVIGRTSTLWRMAANSLATNEHNRIEQERLLTRAPEGSQAIVTFQNPGEDQQRTVILTATLDGYDTLNHGNFAANASSDPKVAFRILPSGHGYVKVSEEPDPPEYETVLADFGRAVQAFVDEQVPGVVVDLRGNLGGNDQLAADLAGFFHKEKTFYETWTRYNADSGNFDTGGHVYIRPQKPYYGGPVIALVNPATISSGEGIAMGIQKSPNGLVAGFHGTNGSFGMVLTDAGSINFISIGDNPFIALIPVGQSLDQNGVVQLDSRNGVGGVRPDIVVPRTWENVIRFADGVDVELEAAIWPVGAQLQALLDDVVSDDGVPGAVMALETPQGSWVGAAGKADLATGQPMTVNTQVRIASITKPFTAALVMRLMEEGYLSLDHTVDTWLPGSLPRYGDRITIRMLLNHTSGIPDHENTLEWLEKVASDPYASWTNQDVLDILHRHQDEFVEPGTAYAYCNTGYYLLGMIIEAATGETVADVINRRFFKPLNLRRTTLTRDGMKNEPYARDYFWYENQLLDTSGWNMSWDWTAGSGVTIASDMLRWTRGLFGGAVVSHGTLEQMRTPVPPATEYGLGLSLSPNLGDFFGEKVIGHNGANSGVYALWCYFPESKRTLFVALNRLDTTGTPKFHAEEVMLRILSGVREIIWHAK